MHALKAGLNADKFATLWMFPKRFYHLFVLQMTPTHCRSQWTQVDFRDFKTHEIGNDLLTITINTWTPSWVTGLVVRMCRFLWKVCSIQLNLFLSICLD